MKQTTEVLTEKQKKQHKFLLMFTGSYPTLFHLFAMGIGYCGREGSKSFCHKGRIEHATAGCKTS